MLAVVGCDSSDSVSLDENQDSGAVSFSAKMVEMEAATKAVEYKTDWADGDQIAIFVDEDGEKKGPFCYDVASDGSMTPNDDSDKIYCYYSDLEEGVFYAFYPFDSSITTFDGYSLNTNTDRDYLSAQSSGTDEVAFTFSHTLAVLCLTIEVDAATTFSINLVTKEDPSVSGSLSYTKSGNIYSVSEFVAPLDDISSQMVRIAVDYDTSYFGLESSEITKWEAGKYYNYTFNLE